MSEDTEYNDQQAQNPEGEEYGDSGPSFPTDAFIPLVLLSISIIVLLGWQVSVSSSERTQLQTAITNQEQAVKQSDMLQAGLKKLAGDLVDAAQTDDVAKAIVSKYVRSNANPSASPAP